MTEQNIDYEKLASDLPGAAVPGSVLTGQAAADAGRAFLLREYGSMDAVEEAMRSGRPNVGSTKRGASPTVRGRISAADFKAFKDLETETGKGQSELVREAIHLLLQQHHKIAS